MVRFFLDLIKFHILNIIVLNTMTFQARQLHIQQLLLVDNQQQQQLIIIRQIKVHIIL